MTSTLPPLVQAFSGALGSAAANTFTYPLDLVVTKLQLQDPKRKLKGDGILGAVQVLRQIAHKHGWRAVYNGLWPDTCATLLSSFFYFYCYSFLRSLSTRRKLSLRGSTSLKPHKPSLLEELLLGFIAGVASRAISTPLNMVTLQLQAQNEDDPHNNSQSSEEESDSSRKPVESVPDIVKDIYSKGGLMGFWRGFQTTTLLSLTPSITMAFLQLFRRLVSILKSTSQDLLSTRGLKSAMAAKPANPNQNMHPWEAFFGGAISNSIAIILLYPLILAKTRVQTSDETRMTQVLTQALNGTYRGSRARPPIEKVVGIEKTPSISGLYQGLDMKLVKGFFSQGVTLLVKGRIEQAIVVLYLMQLAKSRS
ncbi:mitochondrial carrier domain-containing protein [Crepidotus variabilis]|uniref:Mitochondrial carrier domain-containing protein n=1 Tax=Crepidotus variabilis TaxID=179855 RepID=A0A9P6E4B2_9AGAR|nr:mitochondrial carrier domain-containing protein [Crepidotus variabilis]